MIYSMDIQHIWFDFNDTLVTVDKHDMDLSAVERRLPESVSAIHKGHDVGTIKYERPSHNLSADVPGTFGPQQDPWAERVKMAAKQGFFRLLDPNSPKMLSELSQLIRISVFSNMDTRLVMQSLGIDTNVFTNILSPSQFDKPKPHPDAYRRLIEVSALEPGQILYIGSDVEKDIRPVKSLGMKGGIMWAQSPEADYSFADFKAVLDFVRQTKQ